MERQRDLSCLAALTALGCVCVYGGVGVGVCVSGGIFFFFCKLFPCHYRSTLCAVDVLLCKHVAMTASVFPSNLRFTEEEKSNEEFLA